MSRYDMRGRTTSMTRVPNMSEKAVVVIGDATSVTAFLATMAPVP